jgi:hypothetical protein
MSTKPLPTSFIDPELAKTRVVNYKNDDYNNLSTKLNEARGNTAGETKSVWYSLTQLQEWVAEIEHYKGDGIRIYLGQKEELRDGENYSELSGEPRPGQLCLVIVPTKRGSHASSHVNLIYNQLPDFEERLAVTPPRMQEMAFNLGGYCPPWCLTEGEDLFD